MMIKTKRWDDPVEADDGARILVCRYRPRGVGKAEETWGEWIPSLGPSRMLHRAAYPHSGSPISWEAYRKRYLSEQRTNREMIGELARRVKEGETITLLCSSACERESRCHRSILKELIEGAMGVMGEVDGGIGG